MLVPFLERTWHGTTDIATIMGMSGGSIHPPAAAPLLSWRGYARSRGWVAGYLHFSTAVEVAQCLEADEPTVANTVYHLDLHQSDVLTRASPTVREKIRSADRAGAQISEDPQELLHHLQTLYPVTMQRLGARPHYFLPAATFERWVLNPGTLLLGARIGNEVEAVSLFRWAGQHAEYELNASTLRGRPLAAWLVAKGIEKLRALGVQTLNMGGGVRDGDGVAMFKQRFNGSPRKVISIGQIYNRDLYDRLCLEAGNPDPSRWFPPYRAVADLTS